MKKIVLLLFFIIFFSVNIYCTSDAEPVISYADADNNDQAFLFMACYETLLQDRLPGALLVYDKENKKFIGYSTSVTPDDFFNTVHSDNIALSQFIPCDITALLFRALGDTEIDSFFSEKNPSDLMTVCILLRPDKDFEIYDTPTYFAKKALYESISAHGYSNEEFEKMLNAINLNFTDIQNAVLSGEQSPAKAVELVLTANYEKKEDTSPKIYMICALIALLFITLTFFAVLLYRHNRKFER